MRVELLEEKMRELRLAGMVYALEKQNNDPEISSVSFNERLGLLVDHEITHRTDKRLKSRMKSAKLKEPTARVEEIVFKSGRGLDKSLILDLSSCSWVTRSINITIIGATGTGKTYLACALAQRACYEGFTCRYFRLTSLLTNMSLARADGSYPKLVTTLSRIDVLVLDDWGMAPPTDDQRHLLFELIDDRHKTRSLIITSQLPLENWFEQLGDPTIADAIMDRIVNSSYKIKLKGPSMRPETWPLTGDKECTRK